MQPVRNVRSCVSGVHEQISMVIVINATTIGMSFSYKYIFVIVPIICRFVPSLYSSSPHHHFASFFALCYGDLLNDVFFKQSLHIFVGVWLCFIKLKVLKGSKHFQTKDSRDPPVTSTYSKLLQNYYFVTIFLLTNSNYLTVEDFLKGCW